MGFKFIYNSFVRFIENGVLSMCLINRILIVFNIYILFLKWLEVIV